MLVNDFIVNKRNELNYTQKELSDLTNLSERQISFIESGRTKKPLRSSLMKIATALKIDEDKLLKLAGYSPGIKKRKELIPVSSSIEKDLSFIKKLLISFSKGEKNFPGEVAIKKERGKAIPMVLTEKNNSCFALQIEEFEESISIPDSWKHIDFAFRSKNLNMMTFGIIEKSIIFVQKQQKINSGDLAVLLSEKEEQIFLTIKKAILNNNSVIFFDSSGEEFKQPENTEIIGKVVKVLTEY